MHDLISRQSDLVKDIRSGADDAWLMEKYGLSSQGLRNLFKALIGAGLLRGDGKGSARPKMKINTTQILRDVESGMSRDDLMARHGLSAGMLQRVCSKLLAARAVSGHDGWDEITIQMPLFDEIPIRELNRCYLDFELPIYEPVHPEIQGRVRDITERGVGIVGLEACQDEVKGLVIPGDFFGEVGPVEFVAMCRWARTGVNDGACQSGFEIVRISNENLRVLRKLIHLVELGH